jgi:hypothetical protein
MTTIAQVKQVMQPLLQRHDDIILMGRYIWVKPFHHFRRGIFIDPRRTATEFLPITTVGLLVPTFWRYPLDWGEWLHRRIYGNFAYGENDPLIPRWDITNPPSIDLMLEMIEVVALPQLRAIKTFDDFYNYTSVKRSYCSSIEHQPLAKLLVLICQGDLDAAHEIRLFEEDAQYLTRTAPTFLPALAARDRVELARILHEWEAASIITGKMQKIWEPTPFPLELQEQS